MSVDEITSDGKLICKNETDPNLNEIVDINDVLDIFITGNKTYTIIFRDGELWVNAKIRKTVYDKFEKLKKKRGQVDNV